jgi:MFS family permease
MFQLVDRRTIPNAFAINSSLQTTARIVGPAVAGVLIAVVGPAMCFIVNAASFVPFVVALLLLRPSEYHGDESAPEDAGAGLGIRHGLRHVRGNPASWLALLLVAVFTVCGFNYRVLVPLLAAHTLHEHAAVFGLLFAAFGLGGLAGAFASAAYGRESWAVLLGCSAGLSVACFVVAPLRSVVLVFALLLVLGALFSAWTTQSQLVVVLSAPDALRGRMIGFWLFCIAGLAPIGGLLGGWLADIGGTQLGFDVAGAAGAVVTSYVWLRRRAEREQPASAGRLGRSDGHAANRRSRLRGALCRASA